LQKQLREACQDYISIIQEAIESKEDKEMAKGKLSKLIILFNFKTVKIFLIMLNNFVMFFSAGLLKPWQNMESRILSRLKIFRDFQSMQEGVEETRQKLLSFTERCRRKRRQKNSLVQHGFALKGLSHKITNT
jgi:hypothetical protein